MNRSPTGRVIGVAIGVLMAIALIFSLKLIFVQTQPISEVQAPIYATS